MAVAECFQRLDGVIVYKPFGGLAHIKKMYCEQ